MEKELKPTPQGIEAFAIDALNGVFGETELEKNLKLAGLKKPQIKEVFDKMVEIATKQPLPRTETSDILENV